MDTQSVRSNMQLLAIVIVMVLVIMYLCHLRNLSNAAEGCCGQRSEGFALDLSPRGGYPNCKGCVIEPPLEESDTWQPGLWDGAPGLGISTTMSGTVARDWQSIHGNNMKGEPGWNQRIIHSNNISLELDNDKKMHDYLTNPFNYPRYAVAADPSLRPIKVSGCDYCHNSAHGCTKCRIHYGEDKAVIDTGMSKDYYFRDSQGLF